MFETLEEPQKSLPEELVKIEEKKALTEEELLEKDSILVEVGEPFKADNAGYERLMDREQKMAHQRDKESALSAVKKDGRVLEHISPELKNDKEVVMAAVRGAPLALEFASPELKNDREVVLSAIKECYSGDQVCDTFKFASPELRNDKEVVMVAVEMYGGTLELASPELQKDPDVRKAAGLK